MKPSYLGQGNDTAVLRRLAGGWLGRIFLGREMRPRAVVITEVAPQASTEVSLVQDNHKVKELAADGADHAFGEGVLPGRAWCGENLGDANTLHPSSKLAAVDSVAIAEEVARRQLLGECLDNLLRGPGGGGTLSHVEEDDATPMMKQDNEYVEHPKGRGRHDEEVHRD